MNAANCFPRIPEDSADHDDLALMADVVQRRSVALGALYSRYRALLSHAALQIVGNPMDAEEVVQDVFVQLWIRPTRYREAEGKLIGWLLTLSRRRAIDCLRRRGAYSRARQRYEDRNFQTLHECQSGTDVTTTNDLRSFLTRLISQLPPAQKVVVEHAYFRGMSQREIASAMKLPLGTVKTRIELGVRKLAQAVRPWRGQVG